jgi:hypothetical protein
MRFAGPLVLLVVTVVAGAQPVAVGSRLSPLKLQDQHDNAAEVGSVVRLLLFTRDMAGGTLVKDALAERDQHFLDACHAAYIADVSGMPSVVTRLMALPRMRKRPYRVLLDRDGELTASLPYVPDTATLLELEQLRVTRVAHLRTVDEVRTALGGCSPAPP